MIYIPSFIKISSAIKKLIGEIHRQLMRKFSPNENLNCSRYGNVASTALRKQTRPTYF
jgi:hypothetical protein